MDTFQNGVNTLPNFHFHAYAYIHTPTHTHTKKMAAVPSAQVPTPTPTPFGGYPGYGMTPPTGAMAEMLVAQQLLQLLGGGSGPSFSWRSVRDLVALMCVNDVRDSVIAGVKTLRDWVSAFIKHVHAVVLAWYKRWVASRKLRPRLKGGLGEDGSGSGPGSDADTGSSQDCAQLVMTVDYPCTCSKLLSAVDAAIGRRAVTFCPEQTWVVEDRDKAGVTQVLEDVYLTAPEDALKIVLRRVCVTSEVRGSRSRVTVVEPVHWTGETYTDLIRTPDPDMVPLPPLITTMSTAAFDGPIPLTQTQRRIFDKMSDENSRTLNQSSSRDELFERALNYAAHPKALTAMLLCQELRFAVRDDGTWVKDMEDEQSWRGIILRENMGRPLYLGALFGWSYKCPPRTDAVPEILTRVKIAVEKVLGSLTSEQKQILGLMIMYARAGRAFRDKAVGSATLGIVNPGQTTIALTVHFQHAGGTGTGAGAGNTTTQDLQDAFRKWISDQGKHVLEVGKSQPVYTIKIKRVKKIVAERNPEYDAWESSMKATAQCMGGIGGISGSKAADGEGAGSGSGSGSGFDDLSPGGGPGHGDDSGSGVMPSTILKALGCAPPAVLTREVNESTVVVEQVNEGYRAFDTLHLAETTRNALWTATTAFKNFDARQAAMGFAHRLNVLLTGPPGTGKTSTIQAIATELGLPIWYLNLTSITCGEMAAMFRKVYKENGGGVVVLEDIDAMSPIVLRKDVGMGAGMHAGDFWGATETKMSAACGTTPSVVDLTAEGISDMPLNLSYFLNFLDGVLAVEKSVVIATTNHPENLDDAFRRPGRFDITVVLDNATHEQIRSICQRMLSREIDEAVLARIPERKFSTAMIIFHCRQFVHQLHVPDSVVFERFCVHESSE